LRSSVPEETRIVPLLTTFGVIVLVPVPPVFSMSPELPIDEAVDEGAIQSDAIKRCGVAIFAGCCHFRQRGFAGRALSNRRPSRR